LAKKNSAIWAPSNSAAENAGRVLPDMARAYFQSGRKLLNSKVSPENLHSFRLATKRFRYTLELFRPCYGDALKDRLDRLRQIQDYLGDINDCLTTLDLVRNQQPKNSPHSARVAALLNSRAAKKTAEFQRYWKETFDRAGQERWWTDYLERYAGRRS
jgi:CHAD domain-containing protein